MAKGKNLKETILRLRDEGKSYREIEKILQCSKATITYHCGKGQKEKWKQRVRKNRKMQKNKIRKKIYSFFDEKNGDNSLRHKISRFKNRTKQKGYRKNTSSFTYDAAYKIIIENPICYLTGRPIDLSISRAYELDHKIPVTKNGKNTLKNMGLTCKEANKAKSDLTISEFIQLCKEVCEYNGYIVNKKEIESNNQIEKRDNGNN